MLSCRVQIRAMRSKQSSSEACVQPHGNAAGCSGHALTPLEMKQTLLIQGSLGGLRTHHVKEGILHGPVPRNMLGILSRGLFGFDSEVSLLNRSIISFA